MAFSDAWSFGDFAECAAVGVPFLVAVERGSVVGYVIGQTAADEGEILNLGVAPAHRGRGVGHALVERMLALLHERGAEVAYLEVRESNGAARHLYESLGFREVARRRRYYRRPVEDAVVLRTTLGARERPTRH